MKLGRYGFSMVTIYLIIAAVMLSYPPRVCGEEVTGNKKIEHEDTIALKERETIILHVNKASINVADFKEYLSYRPISAPLLNIQAILEERLEEMITSEALYQEALRQNMEQDPKIRRIIHQILTQKLLEEFVEKKVWARSIEEEELQAYYNQHQYEFKRPEQIRLADIFIAVDSNASIEQRAEKKKKAESVLAEALMKESRKIDFGGLISTYSNKHPKYPLGTINYFDIEGKPIGLDTKFAQEAFKLTRIGQISDHVIESAEGYHIIMLIERRPALNRPLDEVKSLIERRIRREELEEKRDAFIKQVKENADIKRNEDEIAELFKELGAHDSGEERMRRHSPSIELKNRHAPPPFPGE